MWYKSYYRNSHFLLETFTDGVGVAGQNVILFVASYKEGYLLLVDDRVREKVVDQTSNISYLLVKVDTVNH